MTSSEGDPEDTQEISIIPALPNAVAQICLARVTRSRLHALRLVNKQWNEELSSEALAGLRTSMGVQERWLCVEAWNKAAGCTRWKAFDLAYGAWRQLAPVPPPAAARARCKSGDEILIMGRASGVVGGHLVVAGGEVLAPEHIIIGDVFAYSPLRNQWHTRASMKHPRAHAVFGVLGGELYVLGPEGIGERYNFDRDEWREVGNAGFEMMEHLHMWPINNDSYEPLWRTFNIYDKSVSCSSRPETGCVFSYDPCGGKWKAGGPVSGTRDGTRAAYVASFNLRCILMKSAPWEVGRVAPRPISLACSQAGNKELLGANIPSPSDMWTDISCYRGQPGALVADGHRLYLLLPGLKLGVFEIEQQGTRCSMISFNDERDYVVSCQLLTL